MVNFQPRGTSRRMKREASDNRKPIYTAFIVDTSGSMGEEITVGSGEAAKKTTKIEELNSGLKKALESLKRFESGSVFYKSYIQIIELNSYGQALYPAFEAVTAPHEPITFEHGGVTCLENSLETLKNFLSPQYLPGCNRAVNVILVSDGYPTDVQGYAVDADVYGKIIEDFKRFLDDRGLSPNVDLYAIGVGAACEEMLKSFADDGRYFKVDEMESLAGKLDLVTRKSIAGVTSRPMPSVKKDDGELEEMAARVIDITKCLGSACLSCEDICMVGAIEYKDGIVTVDPTACIGCGVCEESCPSGAIGKMGLDDGE